MITFVIQAEEYAPQYAHEKRSSVYDDRPDIYMRPRNADFEDNPYDVNDLYRPYELPRNDWNVGDSAEDYGSREAYEPEEEDWRFMGPSQPVVYRRAFYPPDYRFQLPALPGERKRSYLDEDDLER